jgi:hypothetical protein
VVLTNFSPSFMPVIGYQEGVGVDERNATDPKEPLPDAWKDLTDPAFGSAWGYDVTVKVTGPDNWTLNSVGIPGEPVVKDGRKTVTWTSDHPVRFFNIAGGPLERADGTAARIFHSARQPGNIKTMTEALDASREFYGKWFAPYPRRDLRLTEFPGLAGYAQGFPGNITFSESIGFLTKPVVVEDSVKHLEQIGPRTGNLIVDAETASEQIFAARHAGLPASQRQHRRHIIMKRQLE